MTSVQHRRTTPAASQVHRRKAKLAATRTHRAALRAAAATEASDSLPEFSFWDPQNPHGGVQYLSETDWSTFQIPDRRILTVGYPHDDKNPKNPLDFDTINGAIDYLRKEPLLYKNGNKAYTSQFYQDDQHLYPVSHREVIVIKAGGGKGDGGAYLEALYIGLWVELLPDGDVVIQAPARVGAVINIKKATPGRPDPNCLPPTCTDPARNPVIQIGNGAGTFHRFTGRFHIRPFGYPGGLDPNRNQRGIDCEAPPRLQDDGTTLEDRQTLDIDGTTFTGFRAYGSGAAIRSFLGTATDCDFENCDALINTNPGAPEEETTANGGAISGVTVRGEGVTYDHGRTYVREYAQPNLLNCTFLNCSAAHNGGAVHRVGKVILCEFEGCSALAGSGGACYGVTGVRGEEVKDPKTNEIVGYVGQNMFKGCSAGDDGGALSYVHGWPDADDRLHVGYDGMFFLNNCRITNCDASQGGAIANCDVGISACFIDSNKATGAGGGGLYKASRDIDRCSITRNSAVPPPPAPTKKHKKKAGDYDGGGLHSCSGKITNCIIAANHASGDGGGLFKCNGALRHLDILQNKADLLGGGARNCNGPIQNCIILGNWSLKSSSAKADSNQLSNCGAPSHCFLPAGWHGGSQNFTDTREGPGFVPPMPVLEKDDRDEDPTTSDLTSDYYEIVDVYAAQKLRLTAKSDPRLLNSGKRNLGVDRDFEGFRRPIPLNDPLTGKPMKPDVGAFEYPPQ